MVPRNLIEITERSDERMVVRTKRFHAYVWILLMPAVYTVLFGTLMLFPLLSGEELEYTYWSTLVFAAIFIPLGFVYSFFICRKLNVITLDRQAGKVSSRPFLRIPLMRPRTSYDLRELRMLFFGRSLQFQQCLYFIFEDGVCIPLLDGSGHFWLTALREAGRLHEDIAGFVGVPYVNAFADGSSYGFKKP